MLMSPTMAASEWAGVSLHLDITKAGSLEFDVYVDAIDSTGWIYLHDEVGAELS